MKFAEGEAADILHPPEGLSKRRLSIMRQILISLVLTSFLHTAALAQGGARANLPKACALLTQEMVRKVSIASKKNADAATPKELKLGATASACEWGEIILQIDPLTPAQLEQVRKADAKTWELVPGVGDAAYFHNIRDMVGELFVRVGTRTFGVLMEIPAGSTVATYKPNFIDIANAIVPKLR